MARAKSNTNKSAAIREALSASPTKPASEIAKELGVTPTLVYNVKAAMKKKAGGGKAKRGRKAGGRSKASAATKMKAPAAAHNALDSAFEFAVKVGGIVHAEQLISRLKAIKERL